MTGGWFRNPISETFASLWKHIIRPPRDEYTLSDLGPTEWSLNGRYSFRREDSQLRTDRDVTLHCSHWLPVSGVYKEGCQPHKLPCVVYLHSSMGSRREAYEEPFLTALLVRGMSVFAFDQSGSGMSDGEYISVGHFEELDLKAVLEYLRKFGTVGDIGLWGRSMGAITAVNRLRRDLKIKVAVLDSVFTKLKTVGEEMVASGEHIQIPNAIWSRLYNHICHEIKEHAGFEASEIEPIKHAPKIDCPALFATARGDTVVFSHHTQDMFCSWGAEEKDKSIIMFSGDHWDVRPVWFCEEAADFVERHLILKNIAFLEEMSKLAEDKKIAEKAEADARAKGQAEQTAKLEMRKEEQKIEASAKSNMKGVRKVQAKAKTKAKAKTRAKAVVQPKAKPNLSSSELKAQIPEPGAGAESTDVKAKWSEQVPGKQLPEVDADRVEEDVSAPDQELVPKEQKTNVKETTHHSIEDMLDKVPVTESDVQEQTNEVQSRRTICNTTVEESKLKINVIEATSKDTCAETSCSDAKEQQRSPFTSGYVEARDNAKSVFLRCCHVAADLGDSSGDAPISYEHEHGRIIHI